jgi:hypothetical protein
MFLSSFPNPIMSHFPVVLVNVFVTLVVFALFLGFFLDFGFFFLFFFFMTVVASYFPPSFFFTFPLLESCLRRKQHLLSSYRKG